LSQKVHCKDTGLSASLVFSLPFYCNSDSGNGTETRDTLYTEDDNEGILYYDDFIIIQVLPCRGYTT